MNQSLPTSFPKLHPKHTIWLMPLILSGIMSASLACFNLYMNQGFITDFFNKWLHAWSLSWMVAYPLILICLPLVKRFLSLIMQAPNSKE